MRGSAAGRTPLKGTESCPIRLSHSLVAFRHGSDECNRSDQEFGRVDGGSARRALRRPNVKEEANMNADSKLLSRQGQRLLQIGVALLLLLSVEGFAIPHLAAPHLGVSAHKLAGLQSVLMLALGLVWPRLDLGAATSRVAFWLFIYAAFAILAAVVLGAVWGAGNQTMPLAAAAARGSAFQETVIGVVAYSSAPTGLISFALIFWGLRAVEHTTGEKAKAIL
jgi:(hydroxyamino)benzene mutase